MPNYSFDGQALPSRAVYSDTAASVNPNERKLYLAVKRMLDFFGALAGILLLTPLFAIVAVLIKLEDPNGSIFFRQTRVGKDGREFHMFKFRSMVANAEAMLEDLLDQNEVGGAMFKMKDDPRVTRIGRFIRKTSVDELPQLWNVLRGDMSLVGPRPALPREVEEYTHHDRQRLLVTPGCTGLWQVSGRNSLSFSEMVDLDLHYIEKRSFFYDVKLIVRTVRIMISPNSAY